MEARRIRCFNVAASIKMRKSGALSAGAAGAAHRFNVAASIKMRKLEIFKVYIATTWLASMWPHL